LIGLAGVSAQTLSDTIGAIYDCALDPHRWIDAVRQVAELCESTGGGICVHDLRNSANVHLFEFGYSKEFSDTFQANYEKGPLAAWSIMGRVGDVGTLSRICPDAELIGSRYYREVLKPFGMLDFIGLLALRTGGRVAALHAGRTEREQRYAEREISLFKLLAPHVCRTLAISDALDIRTLKSELLEETLDGLVTGVFLISRDGRVVYVNAAGERQIKAGNALRIMHDRLSLTDLGAHAAFMKAIAKASLDEMDAGEGGYSLAIPAPGASGYIATLLPLERGLRQSIVEPFAASIAVFVQEPAQVPPMPGEAFARLYKLTGGELRVLLALAQGLGAKEAADMLGVGEPTVRTHVQHIFSKTGTSRQTDLLRLLQSATPPTN